MNSIRNRSYHVQLERGDIVEFTHSTYFRRDIHVGECAEVIGVSNAGFRGIEVYVRFEDDSTACVSAGIVQNLSR
jgi:hypothetical protein